MSSEARDLIVLGSGPGGYVAAIRAAQLGRKVTIVERDALGGVCLNWGCIPSKALLRSAQLYHDMQRASDFGFQLTGVEIDYPAIIDRSRQIAGKLSQGVQYLMRKNKIEVIIGHGVLKGSHTLAVTNADGDVSSYTYKDLILATGGKPREVPGIDVDGKFVHTSRTILEHKTLHQRILVIGGGAIGIEFAYFLSTLGSKVTVVEMLPQILPHEDSEISDALTKSFKKRGMEIKTGTKVENLAVDGSKINATLVQGEQKEEWNGDACLVAVGVAPHSEGIGLEEVGIETDRGFVKVDEFLRTSVPHHFAIGDVAGGPLLAHKASHEGVVAAQAACGDTSHAMKYDNIPACTYCQPQVASVGLTEEKVKEKGYEYSVGKVPFSAIGKAIATGEPEGMIKVIIDQELHEVLGVHILHAEATELIAEAAAIRSHEGIAESVIDTIHPHPTLSESVMEAMALAAGRPLNI